MFSSRRHVFKQHPRKYEYGIVDKHRTKREMLKDFREIAPRGVIDIATGVAIGMTVGTLMGVAFSKLVISVLNDLVYPILGALMGGLDFSDTYIMLRGKAPDGTSLAEARTLGTPLPIG